MCALIRISRRRGCLKRAENEGEEAAAARGRGGRFIFSLSSSGSHITIDNSFLLLLRRTEAAFSFSSQSSLLLPSFISPSASPDMDPDKVG